MAEALMHVYSYKKNRKTALAVIEKMVNMYFPYKAW